MQLEKKGGDACLASDLHHVIAAVHRFSDNIGESPSPDLPRNRMSGGEVAEGHSRADCDTPR